MSSLGDELLVLTNSGALDFKLVVTPLADPRPENWKDLVPHRPGCLIVAATTFEGHIVWLERDAGLPRIVVRSRKDGAEHVIAIDIHAGVGDYGEDLLLAEDEEYEAARLVFGPRVVLADPHRSAAYRIRGGYERMLGRVFSGGRVHFVAQEFGTYGPLHVVRALREGNRWHDHGDGSLTHPSKVALREAFCPDDDAWRHAVLDGGRVSMQQAVHALAVDDLTAS